MVVVGHTLVELLFVICLVGCATTLLVPRIDFLNRWAVRADIEQLYLISLYLSRSAIASGTETTLVFDTVHNSYCYEGTVKKLSSGVLFNSLPFVKGPPGDPKELIVNSVTFKDNTVRFGPSGASSAGAVYVTDESGSCLYALTIPVGLFSWGKKYRYDGRWVLI
jgi:type II secretory pathway pseudopilin PulG